MPEMLEAPVGYTVRTLFNEETTVEREIIEHLKATKLGWSWRSREQLSVYRPDEREVLLLSRASRETESAESDGADRRLARGRHHHQAAWLP